MNHRLWGYSILFGLIIDGLKGPVVPQFSQHVELDHANNGAKYVWHKCGKEMRNYITMIARKHLMLV